MEKFYADRDADFETYYAEFGTSVYKHLTKLDVKMIFEHAYTLGALQNSTSK